MVRESRTGPDPELRGGEGPSKIPSDAARAATWTPGAPGERRKGERRRFRRRRVVEINPGSRIGWIAACGWAAVVALAVVSGTFMELSHRLRAEISSREIRVVTLSSQLEVEQRWLATLNAPGVRVVDMVLAEQGQVDLRGRAVYDPASHRAVIVCKNAVPPAGKDYELWVVRGGSHASLGVLQANEDGVAVIRVEDAGDPATLEAMDVSLEAKGGSPDRSAPGGPVIMVGPLGG